MAAETFAKRRLHLWLAVAMIVIGIGLLIMMIVVEDEFGAIPLLLIGLGIAWYFATRHRAQTRRE